jgi:hypothetical protein
LHILNMIALWFYLQIILELKIQIKFELRLLLF